ncbi:MAG: DnaJ family molecular chaperone [Myxococcota bacterium]
MRPRVMTLTPQTFSASVGRRRFACVRVAHRPRGIDPGVVDALQDLDPSGVSVAQVDCSRPTPRDFWETHFRTSTGPMRRGGGPVPEGYYLFRDGLIVGHHPGGIHTAPTELARYLMSRAGAARESQGWEHTQESHDRDRRQHSHEDDRRQRAQTPPPAAAASGDAYQVLGLERTATDDEVKSAYKAALKLNHPDRVAHLSPALQQFALAQTQAIREAYDVIMEFRQK